MGEIEEFEQDLEQLDEMSAGGDDSSDENKKAGGDAIDEELEESADEDFAGDL